MRATILVFITLLGVSCGDKGAVSDARPSQPSPSQQAQAPASAPAPLPPASPRGDASGTGQLPPGHPPIDGGAASGTPPMLAPPPAGSGTGASGLTWTLPAGWVEEKPDSAMRRAQFRVPGGAGDGQCVVFYFGPGQGGDPAANAKRWAGQFQLPDGTPAENAMKTSTTKVGSLTVLRVEVAGTYTGGMTMTAEPAAPKPGYKLLGAVAEGPDSNWFFKFTGPAATVEAQRPAFDALIRSLKAGA